MAGLASHALIDVNTVIEVDEVGQIVHARPDQGLVGPITFPHWFEHGRTGPDLAVAVHADIGGWNTGEARDLNRGVAIAAVDAQAAGVVLMTEGHRLRTRYLGISDIGRALQLDAGPKNDGDDKDGAKNRCPGNCVRTSMKDLHRIKRPSAWKPAAVPGSCSVAGTHRVL